MPFPPEFSPPLNLLGSCTGYSCADMSICAPPLDLRTLCGAVLWAASVPTLVWAQPTIAKVMPGSVRPGETTEVRIEGAKLNGAVRVWTSFAASVEIVSGDPKSKDEVKHVTCRLTLSPNAPVGIGGIVVATPTGVSDVSYVMIDDLKTVAEAADNHAPTQAQQVSLPAAIDGESDGTLADYFRIQLRANEQISVEVVAARLGQDFDALVRVLNTEGNELAIADDDPATGADARLVFVAPKDGSYVLEVRDNRFKLGGRYRLRLGKFPLVSTTLPPVVERGAVTSIELRGPESPFAPRKDVLSRSESRQSEVAVALSEVDERSAINLGVKPLGAEASGWTSPIITNLPLAGTKPGPGVSATNVLQAEAVYDVPGVLCGVIETSGERDLFAFKAAKGKAVRFKAITRSAGSPAIAALRVLDAAGKQLAESAVTESDEPLLAFAPPADGTYRLAVEELVGRFGSDFVYAIECDNRPRFSLTLKNDKTTKIKQTLPSGGAFYLDVQCQRLGYDGPIALEVESSQSGWQLVNNVIPAKANEVRMYVQPPIDLAPGELADLRIVGRGEQPGQLLTARMSTLVQLRTARPQTPYPPQWHDGLMFVSRVNARPPFYTLTPRTTSVDLPIAGGEAVIVLDMERIDKAFTGALQITPLGVPAGLTVSVTRVGNGPKEQYELKLKSAGKVAKGQHVFRYFAYGETTAAGRGAMSGDIVVNVEDKAEKAAEAEKKTP